MACTKSSPRHLLLPPVLLLAFLVAAPAAAEPPAPQDPEFAQARTHVVRAGASNPVDAQTGEPGPEPFVYTSFYPQHLQVHRGDKVRWEFIGGYGSWHTVAFHGPGSVPERIVREDDQPGYVAMTDWWLFGHGGPREIGACGRTNWWELAIAIDPAMEQSLEQPPCRLTNAALDEPGEEISSSLWDRFFSMTDEDCETCIGGDPAANSAWVAEVDLEPGTYSYICKMHPFMEGKLEVLPEAEALDNPTPAEIQAEVDADYEAARQLFDELSDPQRAATDDGWLVQVGAQTPDRRVQILQYLPASLPDVQRGDTVAFRAGSQDPNTVTFPAGPVVAGYRPLQGRVSATSACDTDSCEPDEPFAGNVRHFFPSGLMAAQVEWDCEYDDVASGSPGIPFAWLQPRLAARAGQPYGCPVIGGTQGAPEMYFPTALADPLPAPGDLVPTDTTVHASGWLIDDDLPAWYRGRPDGSSYGATFQARFPAAGQFSYVCTLHEFMAGSITVR